jgi:hypothetical protein
VDEEDSSGADKREFGVDYSLQNVGNILKMRNPDSNGFFLPRFGGANPIRTHGRRTLMEAYCAVPPDDPFAVARDTFSARVAELAGPAAAVLTACEMEELLDQQGGEVLRQLLQHHFDLRAAREGQQALECRAPATGTDGITRSRLETGHGRLLASCSARCG